MIGMFKSMWQRVSSFRSTLRKPADARSMQDKMLVSGALTSLDYACNILFRIGSTLIVTRLLAPDIFGLFALIMTFQVIAVMLTDFGVRALIIVSDNVEDEDFLRTCWSVQFVRGLALSAVVGVLALGIMAAQMVGMTGETTVYGAAELPLALTISGLQLTLQGFESVNQHVHAREMRFERITVLNIVHAALGPALTIAIALWWPTVWSLVIAGIAAGLVKLTLTHSIFPGIPMRFCWQREHVSELFDRGKWIMSHSALHVVTSSADKLMLSAFLPASWLGLYFLAFQFVEVPRQLLQRIESAFGLQFFQHVNEPGETASMRTAYYRFRVPFDLVACIFAGGFLTASPAVIDMLYDPRYLEAGYIMQILAIGLPLTGLGLIRDAYSAQKRFRVMTLISLIQAVSIWLGLVVALPVLGSTLGALLAITLYRVPELTALLVMARREGWVDLMREFRFFPLILVGAAMGWGVGLLWKAVAP